MLLKDFYTVISLENPSDSKFIAKIKVNENHEVFKGHFPGNPIMPGVCMMQIIKELTEKITDSTLFMQSLSNVKFMSLINPFVSSELLLEIDLNITEDGIIKVKNSTFFNDTLALKLGSVYRKI
jgi:3-hydroxyacyl-[acyl-carrier-protein] dehydratase